MRTLSAVTLALVAMATTAPAQSTSSPWQYADSLHSLSTAQDSSSSFHLRGQATSSNPSAVGQYHYQTKWFQQTLDHFSYSDATFPQRYLINSDSWGGPGYPILFYTGNEGDIELFAQNTGFMWEIAPEFHAMVVFAEHRYYGKTLPFGPKTWSNLTSSRLRYLSSEQALADYAVLLESLKQNESALSSPVVAFGGSYGGMLAAWIRQKYPSTVAGSIAASAPVLQFPNVTGPKVFNHIITDDFEQAVPGSASHIYKSWAVMQKWGSSPTMRVKLSQMLRPCKPFTTITDVTQTLFGWLNSAYSYLAMADYPYPAQFLGPLPGNPLNVTAKFWEFGAFPSDEELVFAVYQTGNLFYNYSGQAGSCFNMAQINPPGLQNMGWPYQSCTEMVMPIGQYGMPNDLFPIAPWNYAADVKGCQQQFDVTPRPDWVRINYGGWNLRAASNIVFSNGNRDPWMGGGVTHNITGADSVVAVMIQGGAHHLDLRASNKGDPQSVIEARNIHRMHIREWIKNYKP